MPRFFLAICMTAGIFISASAQQFDHKMHFPQLPDSSGWKINATYPMGLADDWQCSESGMITEFDFWGGWLNGIPGTIQNINLAVFSGNLGSTPSWFVMLSPADYTVEEITPDPPGQLGWYDPYTGSHISSDGGSIFHYTARSPGGFFYQDLGQIYWFAITVQVTDGTWGWISSGDHWTSSGYWSHGAPFNWNALHDPITPSQQLDLSFVIAQYEQLGACCMPNGSCSQMMPTDCGSSGGIYNGANTLCLGDNNSNGIDDACEPQIMGACCYPDGSCDNTDQQSCAARGGVFSEGMCLGDNNENGIDDLCEEVDVDGDGIPDQVDNCPGTYNPGQEDDDGDGVGTACDNCPYLSNPDQADMDIDGQGDLCDDDIDGDGLLNADELLIGSNPESADTDVDGVNDFIEVYYCGGGIANPCDTDDDGIPDFNDPDDDGDLILTIDEDTNHNGDPTDDDIDGDGVPNYLDTESDGDGINDIIDNCPFVYNPGQEDSDGDGIGDLCEAAPDACNGSLYSNGGDMPGNSGSQCDMTLPVSAATADDFVLPPGSSYRITSVVAYLSRLDGEDPGLTIEGITVTIYSENEGVPGGHPVQGSNICEHVADIPGGIITTQVLSPGEYTYSQQGLIGNYQFILNISPVTLAGGTVYWLEVQPQMPSNFGRDLCGFVRTGQITGSYSMIICEEAGIPWWSDQFQTDVAFCLQGTPVIPGTCQYTVGDANGNGSFNGLDVVYSVAYFKGGPPPGYSCECTPGQTWYVAGDVNASCNFNGLDVSYMVSYLKGGPPPNPCADCPPAR